MSLIVFHTIADCKAWLSEERAQKEGKSDTGFVPTMGYLHEGHASLIQKARAENDIVVVSIFVNPLQFGPSEDLDRYPRSLKQDLALCETLGVDLVFAPSVYEMYGETPIMTRIHVDQLGEYLCGASRPGHFDGVCTVVAKLFQIFAPTKAYFGKKDAQQWRILRRMVADLSIDVSIIPCPIVRENDGLAKSSRNVYLTAEQRREAPALQQALQQVLRRFQEGERNVDKLRDVAMDRLNAVPGLRLDYLSFVDDETLTKVMTVDEHHTVLCAVAAYFGSTRLIDNQELVGL